MDTSLSFLLLSLLLLLWPPACRPQQQYENNVQLDCSTNSSSTLGYSCSNATATSNCTSFLTFRSTSPYDTIVSISYLLSTPPSSLLSSATFNRDDVVSRIPATDLVLATVICSCSAGGFYHRDANYTLQPTDVYFSIANNTYQGLTTCLAIQAQNPDHEARHLKAGTVIAVPLRCACPSAKQIAAGFRFLLTYLVFTGDELHTIASRFHVEQESIADANGITVDSTIYPFTSLLIPLKSEPTADMLTPATPPPPPPPPVASSEGAGGGSKTGVYIGVGIGVGILGMVAAGFLFFFYRRRRSGGEHVPDKPEAMPESTEYEILPSSEKQASIPGLDVRGIIDILRVYKYTELEKATESFADDRRINGSTVYRGEINGEVRAIKRLKGNAAAAIKEINLLKRINHSSIIRLMGICTHQTDTYLVFEFAENGSLDEWLRRSCREGDDIAAAAAENLSWKQRVQIACDVADGLNYLHSYVNPPYIHKNVESSNVLLNADFRAKLSNFGLARLAAIPAEDGDSTAWPQLTTNVVGTQGYMAPEYIDNGLITPWLDVFAFGVLMLELLSGKGAVWTKCESGERHLLWEVAGTVLSGEHLQQISQLREFIDPRLQEEYPTNLALQMAALARQCASQDMASRPSMTKALLSLSAIYNSTLDWEKSFYGGK